MTPPLLYKEGIEGWLRGASRVFSIATALARGTTPNPLLEKEGANPSRFPTSSPPDTLRT